MHFLPMNAAQLQFVLQSELLRLIGSFHWPCSAQLLLFLQPPILYPPFPLSLLCCKKIKKIEQHCYIDEDQRNAQRTCSCDLGKVQKGLNHLPAMYKMSKSNPVKLQPLPRVIYSLNSHKRLTNNYIQIQNTNTIKPFHLTNREMPNTY